MKLAFISDIHGNAIALETVLKNLEEQKIDRVFVLGDLCYRGPEPKRSLDLVRSLNTEVIKGNADEWVVRGVLEGEVPVQALELMNKERDWTVSQLDSSDIDYLKNLPTSISSEVEGVTIHAFHATPDSLFDVVLPDANDNQLLSSQMSGEDADVYIYAHIHKPYIRYIDGKVIINIGSVGLPFDGLAKASYGIVEVKDGNITTSIQRVSVDLEKVTAAYDQVNYPNAEMMKRIVRNGKI
ncbi:metallophosphoesterase family protein [Litchfieldia alkalitelluris]|uniref:metallophosphoesterase family protein n=1 Tax=Litchfieldia alkalitelluris TaxID=304268 RepID=UPI000998E5F6|nr:YfcE family phosphodiesterase [Litchfieldia alkalitelluris]